MDEEEKLHINTSEPSVPKNDKNVKLPDMENLDINLHDTEEMTSKDVSSFVEVEASTVVAGKSCEKPMQIRIIADMISHIMESSKEKTISEIINGQDDKSNQIDNLEVDNSCITSVVTVKRENSQQVSEINSDLIQESSNINVTSNILIPETEMSSDTSHVTGVLDQENITPNEKEKITNVSHVVDKSQLPPDVVKVLKNMLDKKVKEVPSDKKQPTKRKIIVAKVPTSALKQMIASKDDGTQVNKVENYSIQSNSCVTKLPPNLAKALRNIIVQKVSSQVKNKSTTNYQQCVETKVPSDVPNVLNKTYTERQNVSPCTKTALQENYQQLLHNPCKLFVSKYHNNWMQNSHEFEYFEKNCDLDFGEHILLSSRKCLLLTLPLSPGFEDEKTINTQIIAEESGTKASFEFTEDCALEKEFNKMFHYFSCPNLSNTTPREIVMQHIFQTMKELLTHFTVQDALKLTCNCSLCWYIYVRGKIISTYYPEHNLNFYHSPLASYRTVAFRNIEITDLIPKSNEQYHLQEDHYFLPIRFKRAGRKRDLTKTTALCSSFNPRLNGNVPIRRSKEAEIKRELAKYYKLKPTKGNNKYSYINNKNNDEQFSNQIAIATNRSTEVALLESTTVNAVTNEFIPSMCHSSLNSSVQNEKNGISSKSSVMFAETLGKKSHSKPLIIYSAAVNKNSSSKPTISLKSYGPAASKSSQLSKRKNIVSTSVSSQILSTKMENILDNSVTLSNPVSSDLNEVKTSNKTTPNSSPMKTKSDFLTSNNNDDYNKLKGEVMTAITCPQISKPSQKQMSVSHSSTINITSSSSRVELCTNPNKVKTLNPKKIYYTGILNTSLTTHKSNVQISNQCEGQDCTSNLPIVSSVSPMTIESISDINNKTVCPIPSDLISTNVRSKTKTSYVQTPSKCLEPISPVTESLSSGSKYKLDLPVPSDATSNKLMKQTETSDSQETTECHKSSSSVLELPSSDVEHKLESLFLSDSTSSKLKHIEISHFQVSEESLKSSSPLIELPNSDVEDKLDSLASTDSTSSEPKKQIEISDVQETMECDKSSSSVLELYSSDDEQKLESFFSSDSTSSKLKHKETSYVQESKESLNSSTSLMELSSCGVKDKLELPASNKLKNQIETFHIEESTERHLKSSSSVIELPSSEVDFQLESLISYDSTSDKLKEQIGTSQIQEPNDCHKSSSSTTEISSCGIKRKLDSDSTSSKLKKEIETSQIQEPNDCSKSNSSITELPKCGNICKLDSDSTLSKLKKRIETSQIQELSDCSQSSSSTTEISSCGIKRKLDSDSISSKRKKQIEASDIEESEDCLKSISLLEESSNHDDDDKHKLDVSVSTDTTSKENEKQQISKEHPKSITQVKNSLNMGDNYELGTLVSKTKEQTQAGMPNTLKKLLKTSPKKTPKSIEKPKPLSSGINIIKLPNSSNLFGTLQNLGVSSAVNVVNLPSESVSGMLKTLGVSNASTVSLVKLPKSCLPGTLPTIRPCSGALNVVHVNANANVMQLPNLAPCFQTFQVQNPGTIQVVQVPNASVVQLPKLIGPLQLQSPYSAGVNVQVPNTNVNILQHPIGILSGPFQLSSANTVSVVQDPNTTPSSEKALETSNSDIPMNKVSEDTKVTHGIQRRKQVFSVGTYNDGVGGFRGFKT